MPIKLNTIHQLRLCVLGLLLIIVWSTYKYVSFGESLPLIRIQSNSADGSTEIVLLPVLVEVYYEALCPDSRSFFLKQLLPTYEKIPSAMNVMLVPYGKAKTSHIGGNYKFECQHGPAECLANKVHACSAEFIPDVGLSLRYASCMIDDNMNAEEVGSQCAKKFGIEWNSVWQCARGPQGSELLAKQGKKTDLLGHISFVPTIALQGRTDRQPAILKDLLKEICSLYKGMKPEGCM